MNLLILVVDDEPDVEVLFRQQFRHDLRTSGSPWILPNPPPWHCSALTMQATVTLILILSDINMPGMSGLELLPKARAARPDVPVIMITAYGDAETKRRALEGGAEALLAKPIGWSVAAAEAAGEREAGLDHYRLGLWRHGQYPHRHEPRGI